MEDDSKSEVFAAIEVMVGAASRSTVVDGSRSVKSEDNKMKMKTLRTFTELIDAFNFMSTVSWHQHVWDLALSRLFNYRQIWHPVFV